MTGNKITNAIVRQMVRSTIKNPQKNLPRAVSLARAVDRKGVNTKTYDNLDRVLQDENNNWNIFMQNIFTNVSPDILEKLANSLVLNSAINSFNRRQECVEKYDCNIPWAILMDPTAACNLKCTGCWAAEYEKQANLSNEVMNRIIEEGKEIGVYTYLFSGGEPLMRKKDLIALCDKHQDCVFLSFTNGSLVDEAFAKEMRRVGNFALAFSIEGFEEETDARRGKGAYKNVLRAMDLLRDQGVPFGFSTCYTSANVDCVGSDEYVDFLIDKGALFGWYFTYIPVGQDAATELIATPEQREHMYRQTRKWRETKPAFLIDFWNDGEYTLGCVAGGRNYLHINANGDVEPCAFVHYSNTNINDSSLLDALQDPIFMEYKNRQPFNKNHLRPCPMMDNPEILREMVEKSGARSTEALRPESAEDLTAKTQGPADEWAKTADRIWSDPNEARYKTRSNLYNQD